MTRKKLTKTQAKKESPTLTAKKQKVESVAKTASKYPVIALLNLRALPDRIMQSAKKKLRGKAQFVVAKNSVLSRALEKSGKKELASHLDFPASIVFTSMSPYELFKFFKDNKAKVAAKPGQVAPFDIVVHEGETDLPPGPALSELKGAGINAQIKAGKIVIAKDSVVAKAGTKITDNVCKALQKLNILPFEAMVHLVAAYDGKFTYTSTLLDIDEHKLYSDLIECLAQGFNVSVNASYPTQQNIDYLMRNSISQARNMAINGQLYSEASTDFIITHAVLIGNALSGRVGDTGSKPADTAGASTAAPAAENAAETPKQ